MDAGQDPTLNFVGVSYSNELSGKLARDCLSIIQQAYRNDLSLAAPPR